MLVKRVLAIGGDIVQTLPPYPEPEVKVPEGHVWVEGDDSFHTDDSNRLGPIPSALIDSKLVCILWPLDRFGPVTVPDSHSLESINPADSRTKRRVMDAIQRAEWRKSRVLRRGGPHSD
ncbi:hypothetical protein ONZ45_g40 [Pleurotus djamor]|nr:hypothetical protein ONZ45_g40 [Pleurotus djamor]